MYRAKMDKDIGIKGCPKLNGKEQAGYKLQKNYFVDNSGLGDSGEAALTFGHFLGQVKKGRYYGITDIGQFQVFIGEYTKIKA